MYHNSRGKHIALGVIAALLSVSVFSRLFGDTFMGSFLTLGCFAGIIFLAVNVIGPIFDRKKREQKKRATRLSFAPPEKYNTLHAVSHLNQCLAVV